MRRVEDERESQCARRAAEGVLLLLVTPGYRRGRKGPDGRLGANARRRREDAGDDTRRTATDPRARQSIQLQEGCTAPRRRLSLSLCPPLAENVCTFTSVCTHLAPLIGRTVATPRHSRQPPVIAEATVSARADGDPARTRSPSPRRERGRFQGTISVFHPCKTTSLAQQRDYSRATIRVRVCAFSVRLLSGVARARVTECSPRLEVARPDAPLLIIVVPPVPPAPGPAGGRGCARDRPNQKGGG